MLPLNRVLTAVALAAGTVTLYATVAFGMATGCTGGDPACALGVAPWAPLGLILGVGMLTAGGLALVADEPVRVRR